MVYKNVDFDNALRDIGQFGRYQLMLYMMLMLMEIPGAMHHLGQVFLAGSMDYKCAATSNENSTSDSCMYYDNVTNTDVKCTQWVYDRTKAYTSTLVSEYNLVCDQTWLQALSQTIYMIGVLVGVLGFGALADRYGRHKIMMTTVVCMIVFGTACAFMPDYWSFVFMRMMVGANAGANMTIIFVIVMEFLGGRGRTACGILVQGFFGLGVMIMALLGYFITDFRYLQLTISIVYVVFLSYYWLIPESVRWQLVHGEDPMKTIRFMARMNRRKCPENLDDYVPKLNVNTCIDDNRQQATLFDLYKTPNLRYRTLNLQFNWMVNSFVYYSISLLATDLAGNVYINTFLSGLSEFMACIVFAPLVMKLGRRSTLSACLLLGGALCFGAIPIPKELGLLRTAFAIIGKFFIAGSFAVVYVYSAELFPTVVRSVGMGSSSMCARIGGVISPFITLLNRVWQPLPFFIFGGSAVIAGVLTLLLPETLNHKLPETIEDGENFGADQDQCWSRCCGKKADRPLHSEVLYVEPNIAI